MIARQKSVYDLLVVGGGIVGCATAREARTRHPDWDIAILEKEDSLGNDCRASSSLSLTDFELLTKLFA